MYHTRFYVYFVSGRIKLPLYIGISTTMCFTKYLRKYKQLPFLPLLSAPSFMWFGCFCGWPESVQTALRKD